MTSIFPLVHLDYLLPNPKPGTAQSHVNQKIVATYDRKPFPFPAVMKDPVWWSRCWRRPVWSARLSVAPPQETLSLALELLPCATLFEVRIRFGEELLFTVCRVGSRTSRNDVSDVRTRHGTVTPTFAFQE
ncbi:hypothetical protein ElyMa_004693600 [Elysia marginata]|uniref:Uncharacterized protein n=1 Tax=Elysia marginata TaxID=1093978 RepID=A0AAV4I759_9GAST|nr:hypothetical protein ElyMa_004693600 [Elysia marginata]